MYGKPLFHLAYLINHHLSENLAFVVLGMSAVSAFAWQRRAGSKKAWAIALTILAFGAGDLLMLAALPRLGLSYGPTLISFTWISVGRACTWLALLILVMTARFQAARRPSQPAPASIPLPALWVVNLAISALALYGMYVEPFDLRVTTLRITSPKIQADRPIRIVQLSDIHVERITRRERAMLAQVQALQPDLIVMTGDYLNIDYVNDPHTRQDGRAVLAQLSAPSGIYAVTGTRGVDTPAAMQELFAGLPIRLLKNERATVDIAGASLDLVGVEVNGWDPDRAALAAALKQVPAGRYSILLYHTPDLAEAAAAGWVDLYLAGHTHGGQIRLPWWGALVTMSAYGKRFEAGLYALDETRLYVSRGIGMEGLRLPRARFLAPPEIVLIELAPGAQPDVQISETNAP